jgi:ubiquinone/menaquinone biosynthesis C-methylase UbiE
VTRLNDRELAAMDSPLRRVAQRFVELPTFARMLRRAGIDLDNGRILDVGCGNGFGMTLLARRFRPRRLAGIDLMSEQIERARTRVPSWAEVSVGDATHLDFADAAFDAVFVFGILHHVPEWRAALVEIARVLRPGGALCVEELHGSYIAVQDRVIGTAHPRAAAFDWPTFRGGLEAAGLVIASEASLVPGAARSWLAVRPPICDDAPVRGGSRAPSSHPAAFRGGRA